MKYWIVALLGLAAGIAAGYLTTQFTLASNPEYFSVSYYPDGVPTDADLESPSASGPRVTVVNGEVHDFGSMKKNETMRHAFKIRNVGEKPLEIELMGTTCKCTVGEIGKSQVAPQETVDVVLEWKTVDYSRNFSQSATLKTNDPTRIGLELRVEGRVVQPVWAAPEELILTNVVASKGTEASIHIYGSEPGLEVTSVELDQAKPDDWMHVSLERLPAQSPLLKQQSAADGFEVKIKVDAGIPLEPISRTLRFQTNRTPDGPLEVNVSGAVRGDISINPRGQLKFDKKTNLIDLGLVDTSLPKEVEFDLIARPETGVPIKFWIPEDGIDPQESLQAIIKETRELGNLQVTTIKVTIPADAKPVDMLGPERESLGRIEVLTDHENDKRIVIFVRFAVPG